MTAAHYSFTNLFAWAEKYNIPEHNFPRDREKLVHMKTLVLVGLGIKFLPKEIALLKNLKTVLLGYNELQSLPQELFALESLEHLCIQGNKIEYIGDSIAQLTNLRTLHAFDNKINFISPKITQLKNLEYLTLYNNAFSELAYKTYLELEYPKDLHVSFQASSPSKELKELSFMLADQLLPQNTQQLEV